MSIYLLLELQVLSFYILTSFKRNSTFSTESGLRYFILGSLISCIFLLGTSFLYGAVGSLNFHHLQLILTFQFSNFLDKYIEIFLGLITLAFFFKLTVAPFHF